jgi:hypothetical protein
MTNNGFLTPVKLELSVRRVEGRSCLKVYDAAKEWDDRNAVSGRRLENNEGV